MRLSSETAGGLLEMANFFASFGINIVFTMCVFSAPVTNNNHLSITNMTTAFMDTETQFNTQTPVEETGIQLTTQTEYKNTTFVNKTVLENTSFINNVTMNISRPPVTQNESLNATETTGHQSNGTSFNYSPMATKEISNKRLDALNDTEDNMNTVTDISNYSVPFSMSINMTKDRDDLITVITVAPGDNTSVKAASDNVTETSINTCNTSILSSDMSGAIPEDDPRRGHIPWHPNNPSWPANNIVTASLIGAFLLIMTVSVFIVIFWRKRNYYNQTQHILYLKEFRKFQR